MIIFYPRILIANTDEKIMDEIVYIFSELNLPYYLQSKTYSVGKRQRIKYELLVNGLKNCSKVLPYVIPYLIAKKERAQKLLLWCESRLSKSASKYTKEDFEILSIRQRV